MQNEMLQIHKNDLKKHLFYNKCTALKSRDDPESSFVLLLKVYISE